MQPVEIAAEGERSSSAPGASTQLHHTPPSLTRPPARPSPATSASPSVGRFTCHLSRRKALLANSAEPRQSRECWRWSAAAATICEREGLARARSRPDDMDINALLSPTESGSRESSLSVTPSPRASRNVRPAGGKRTTSGLSNEVSRQQPEAFPSRPTSAHLASTSSFTSSTGPAAAPNFRPLQPPPTSNPSPAVVRGSPVADGYAQQRPGIAHRPSSTPELNVLACESRSDV